MDIKLNNGKVLDLRNSQTPLSINQIDKSSISIFNMIDQNHNGFLESEEISSAEIAETLYDNISGFGTSDSFISNFNCLSSKNIISTLKFYKQKHNNGLLLDIAREYEFGGLDLETRKKCLLKIKDLIFSNAKNIPDLNLKDLSKKYNQELNRQATALGRMDTVNLESILDSVIARIELFNSRHNSSSNQVNLNINIDNCKNDYNAIDTIVKVNKNNITKVLGNNPNLVTNIINNKNILMDVKQELILHLIQCSENYPQLEAKIVASALFHELNSEQDYEPEKITKLMKPENMTQYLLEYEEEAHKNKCDNNTVRNKIGYKSAGKTRYASNWAQTMLQGILNSESLSTDRKRLIQKEIFKLAAQGAYDKPYELIQRNLTIANVLISDKIYSTSDADELYLLLFELLPGKCEPFDHTIRAMIKHQ